MDEVLLYSLELASSIVKNTIQNFDPNSQANSTVNEKSLHNSMRISRISYNVLQQEMLAKNPFAENAYDDVLLAPDIILEQHESSDEGSERGEEGHNETDIKYEPCLEHDIPPISRRKTIFTSLDLSDPRSSTKNQILSHDNIKRRISSGFTSSELAFLSNLNRVGSLTKKTGNIFFRWQTRYVVLENAKLMYARSQRNYYSKKKFKTIDLENQIFRLVDTFENHFSLLIESTGTIFEFRAESKKVAADWIERLTKLQNYLSTLRWNQKLSLQNNIQKIETMTEHQFLKAANTGDILLFQTSNFVAKMQRKITRSDYDHVALVIRFTDDVHFFDATGNSGVGLTSWDDFQTYDWQRYYTKIVIRHLEVDKPRRDIENMLYNFISDTSGAEYQLNLAKMFRQHSIVPGGKAETEARKNQGYFCSELVAAAYKKIGVLEANKSSAQYWPGSFSEKKNLKLLNGARLSNEIKILFI